MEKRAREEAERKRGRKGGRDWTREEKGQGKTDRQRTRILETGWKS